MATVTFDTLKYVRQLEAAGIAPQQAEAFVTAQRDILSEALDTQLATKADISDLRHDLRELKTGVKTDISEAKSDTIKWLAGLLLAQAALVATLVKLL